MTKMRDAPESAEEIHGIWCIWRSTTISFSFCFQCSIIAIAVSV